jgi:transposase-like protein
MEQKRRINRYDENFRRTVITEYLQSGCKKIELLRKYDIKFKAAIQTWMRLYGYSDIHILNQKSIKLANQKLILKESKKDIPETDPVLLLKKIKELERQLEDERIRSEGYSMMLDIAEKEYKIPIRKKPNTK